MRKNSLTRRARQWLAVGAGCLLMLFAVAAANFLPTVAAQQGSAGPTDPADPGPVILQPGVPFVGHDARHDTSPALRTISIKQATTQQAPKNEHLERVYKGSRPQIQDPVLQRFLGSLAALNMPAPIRNFEGVHNLTGASPPDTNGDVGPNHYVQWVNTSFQIFDKSGTSLYGPAPGNTLWAGFGGICEFQNEGDPIALYDPLADRWLMSQFGFRTDPNGNAIGPYYQCVAISATPDPLGAWHRYAFKISDDVLNDYGKFGVWPEAYYASFNMFPDAGGFAGGGFAAFDRAQMLAGQPASFQFILEPGAGGDLPSDLDGHALPPAGAPNMFLDWWDTIGELHAWFFHADFNNPANSTFTGPVTINVAPFNLPCGAGACIPQPGTSQELDTLSDRLMYRLAYRNFGTHESWVTNHTVDVSPVTTTVQTAVRWYELRTSGVVTPTLYQQGTYAGDSPNSDNRWMGSAAMDQQGNLAVGYSVSSSSVYPSIRYTGRLVTDTLGTLPQGEATLVNGAGSQLTSLRWGDYSMLSVDPVDDCTFWYTQEYYQLSSGARWQTRIGSFKFPGCPSGAVTPSATAVPANPSATVTPQNTPTAPPGATATNTPVVPCGVTGVFTGSLTASDPVHANSITRTFAPSECDFPKSFPGVTTGNSYHYDTYTFYNPSNSPQCVTIQVNSACNYYNNTRIFSAAYLNSFDPTNLATNYLGDLGYNAAGNYEYQVTVPGNSTYVVVVDEYNPGTGCPSYTVQVNCGIAGGTPTATTTAVASATAPAATVTATAPAGTATATPVVNCPLPFTDVDQFNPFYQYIQCLYCRGIISGYSDNTFRWGNDVTRGQVSKIIANAAGFNDTITGQTFTDVDPANPFYVYIERLYRHGDISGYDTAANCPSGVPCFRWELPVTRGQLAKIDANAAGYNETPPTGTQSFRDVPASQTFYVFIERLSLHGVISGYTCGGPGEPCPGVYYRPNANITRGQVSKVAAQTFFPNACAPAPPPSATATATP
ncbi:MAG TPA: S-layer homology domain-containing protein [Chloroflexia bacterium]|nr:S-layer homology domain-containing protein [Chloroflexia bacterium]